MQRWMGLALASALFGNGALLPAHANDAALALQPSTQLSIGTPTAPTLLFSAPAASSAQPGVDLSAHAVLVFDRSTGRPLLEKNADLQTPIASITKIMTAMLVLDAGLPLQEKITITAADRDTLKGTGSRLAIGSSYTREQLLHLALIASDNRAAHALARTTPGGVDRFVANMNRMARVLGLAQTRFTEPTGLSSGNVSTARDLARLTNYAYQHYPEIRQMSTAGHYSLGTQRVVLKEKKKERVVYRPIDFANTNRFTRDSEWNVGLSKTGFINEAGHCLVMQAQVAARDVIIVLLDARGKNNRAGDATRIKQWLETQRDPRLYPASRT